MTDVYNDVYEHDDEDDNLKAKVISLKTLEFFPVVFVITQILPENDKLVGDLLEWNCVMSRKTTECLLLFKYA